MDRFRVAHTADLHLGQDLPFLGPSGLRRAREKVQAFFDLLDLCGEEGVDILLIAGDFLEGSPARSLIQTLCRAMEEAPFDIFIAPGNHDYVSADSPYILFAWPDNVHIFKGGAERMDFPEKKLSVYGAAFPSAYVREPIFGPSDWETLMEGPGQGDADWVHLAVIHGDLVQGQGTSLYNPILPASWPLDFLSYVALGHIHQPSAIERVGKTAYAYSGPPISSSFSNLDIQGFYLGWVDAQGAQMDRCLLPEPAFYAVNSDVSDCHDMSEVAAKLLDQLRTYPSYDANYYRVILEGSRPERQAVDPAWLEANLSDEAGFLEVVDGTHPAVHPRQLVEAASLEGAFTRALLDLAGGDLEDLEGNLPSLDKDKRQVFMAWNLGLEAIRKERDQLW